MWEKLQESHFGSSLVFVGLVLSVCQSGGLSVCQFVSLSVELFLHLLRFFSSSFVYLLVCLIVCLSVCLFVFSFVCLSCLSVFLECIFWLYVCLFVCLFVYPFVRLSFISLCLTVSVFVIDFWCWYQKTIFFLQKWQPWQTGKNQQKISQILLSSPVISTRIFHLTKQIYTNNNPGKTFRCSLL